MTESTPQHDEKSVSLDTARTRGSRQSADRCDRFRQGGFFMAYPRRRMGLGLLRPFERGDEPQ